MTTEASDADLLREYARSGSQTAFAEIVRRHADWVYSASRRVVRDVHAAEDATQAVFFLLSQRPEKAMGKPLAGWLFNVMRYCTGNIVRSEERRIKYEKEAAGMNAQTKEMDEETLWDELSPILEDAMARLRSKDRDLLLLRFYQHKTLAEIGDSLAISEEAARKRVSGAVDRLRNVMGGLGVTAPALAIGGVLTARTTQAAPAALAHSLAHAAVPSASVVHLAQLARRMIVLTRLKFAAAVIFLGAVIPSAAGVTWYATMKKTEVPAAMQNAPSVVAAAATQAAPGPGDSAGELPITVDFETGINKFLPGDTIKITEVRGTSNEINPVNNFQVKGTYVLNSHDDATLAVFVTSIASGEHDTIGERQIIKIKKGQGEFNLFFQMENDGYPHLSFYPSNGQGNFGGIYFGTGESVRTKPF